MESAVVSGWRMSVWTEKRLDEMIDVNPVVKLIKGEAYPFIDIDKVERQNERVNLHRQSQNLARQRDLLLSRLMSGKMEVN